MSNPHIKQVRMMFGAISVFFALMLFVHFQLDSHLFAPGQLGIAWLVLLSFAAAAEGSIRLLNIVDGGRRW